MTNTTQEGLEHDSFMSAGLWFRDARNQTTIMLRPLLRRPQPAALPREGTARLLSIPQNPLPGRAEIGWTRSARGMLLRTAFWPATGPCRGTVVLLQGRCDFIEKYFETVRELRRRGFAVATFDWRGQGGSGREIADTTASHVADFALYQADLDCIVEDLLADCPRPFLALGHSMGGCILLESLIANPSRFAGAVLTAPMVGLSPGLAPPMAASLVSAMTRVGLGRWRIPGGPVERSRAEPDFDDNVLTSDPHRYARLRALNTAAPNLGLGNPTVAWVRAAFAAMGRVNAQGGAERISVPVLAVAGAADKVTDTLATRRLIETIPAGRMVVLPGCRHEVLLERDPYRVRFWAAFERLAGEVAPL